MEFVDIHQMTLGQLNSVSPNDAQFNPEALFEVNEEKDETDEVLRRFIVSPKSGPSAQPLTFARKASNPLQQHKHWQEYVGSMNRVMETLRS